MSFPTQMGVALAFAIVLSIQPAAAAEDKQITLMLGGKFCEFYPDDIKKALKELSGVKTVDLESMKKHALVTVDTSETNANDLVAAVNKVKGSGWHCTADVME